jgi:YVTN family beta-propeller protein
MPKAVSISPDGSTLYVTNFGHRNKGNLDVIDTATFKRRRVIDFPGNAIESVVCPSGRFLYTTNYYGSLVQIHDTRSWQIAHAFRPGSFPKMMAIATDGPTLYVTSWSSATLAAVDIATQKVSWQVKTGRHPRGIAVSPRGRFVYVANAGGKTVTVVDTRSRAIVSQIRTDDLPRHLVLSPDGRWLYVSTMKRSYLQIIDTRARKVVASVPVAPGPRTIDLSKDGRFVYLASFPGHAMSIVDVAARRSATLPLDIEKGSGLVVHPKDRKIYVTGWCSNDLWAVERIPAGETPGPLGTAAPRRYPVRRDPRTVHDLGCGTPEQIQRRDEAKARRDAARRDAARRDAARRDALESPSP